MFDGDSQTVGNAGGGTTYPAKVIAGLTEPLISRNVGIGSTTLADMAAAPGDVDSALFDTHSRAVVVIWGGTNDLYFGADAATTHARLVAYCDARRAAGWEIVVVTALPRSNAGTPAGYEAERVAFNVSVRAGFASYADGLADVASNALIGDAGDETNATYFTDLVHLSDAGRVIVAAVVESTLNSIGVD